MTIAEWEMFLHELSRVALAEDRDTDPQSRIFPAEVHAAGYLGYEGATEGQIAVAERRLGSQLPPTYRAFLQVSNGWPMISSTVMPGRLWPVEGVYWLRDKDPYGIQGWGETCDPAEDISPAEHLYWRDVEQSSVAYREAYVAGLLSISDHGDACDLLLSPEVVDNEGEWECWHVASWKPGASRYQSFEAWFVEMYKFMGRAR